MGKLLGGDYELLEPLRGHEEDALYRGRDIPTGQPVLLRLMKAADVDKALAGLREQGQVSAAIRGDHVARVLDVRAVLPQSVVVVFGPLAGESLLERLRRAGPMALPQLHPIVEQILLGLRDAHAAGVLHRDLKPDNVFLTQRSGAASVKLLNCGIRRVPAPVSRDCAPVDPGLGSFMFMPPEQIQKAAILDARADLYALGTLVFQALTGHLPYSARSMVELVQMKTSVDPRSLAQASGKAFPIAAELWASCCLARDPGQRFASAELAAEVWRALAPPGEPAPA